jgi:hypothetical protein
MATTSVFRIQALDDLHIVGCKGFSGVEPLANIPSLAVVRCVVALAALAADPVAIAVGRRFGLTPCPCRAVPRCRLLQCPDLDYARLGSLARLPRLELLAVTGDDVCAACYACRGQPCCVVAVMAGRAHNYGLCTRRHQEDAAVLAGLHFPKRVRLQVLVQ